MLLKRRRAAEEKDVPLESEPQGPLTRERSISEPSQESLRPPSHAAPMTKVLFHRDTALESS